MASTAVEVNVEGVEPAVAMFFVDVAEGLVKDPSIAASVQGVIQFEIKGSSEWVVDLRRPPGRVVRGSTRSPDTRIQYASARVFEEINAGKRSATLAFTTGQVKVTGDFGLVTALIKRVQASTKAAEAETRARAAAAARAREAELTPHYGGPANEASQLARSGHSGPAPTPAPGPASSVGGLGDPAALVGGAGADAETAQLAERMALLDEKIRLLRQDAEAATLPLALPPSLEGAAASSELAAVVVYPLAYLLTLAGWRTVPISLLLAGVWAFVAGDSWFNLWAAGLLAAGAMLWFFSVATGPWELLRRRLRVFGTAGVVFVDYKLTQLRAADLQDQESGPLYNAVHRRSAVRSLVVFRELQGLWVKLGQYLSSRADVMPDQYTEVYGALQDSMPARPLAEAQQTLEEDLKKPAAELFDNLQEEALAAASIGQVHRATTKSGLEVAVKVKHRSIDRVLNQDLENLNIILGMMAALEPDVDISSVMEEWSKEVRRELDLENEAKQMMAVRLNLIRDGIPAIVPRIPDNMFGKRVLVMRFVEGVKMSTPLAELDRMGVDREAICRHVLRAFAQQIYVDGLFNGDPHPGNIMVIQRGTLREGDPADVEAHREAARRRARSGAVPAALGPAGDAAAAASVAGSSADGHSPVMDGDDAEWVPVLLDFGLTKLLPRHVRLAFCKMVLAGQELDGNMLMEAFEEMGMRFSNENVMEDMEGIKHMFRDAVPKEEARAQAKAKAKEDDAKKEKAKSAGKKERKLEAWPGELILFMRVSELLNGLAALLEVRVPTLQIMAAAARVGMLRRFPLPKVAPTPSREQIVASRLRLMPGAATAARGEMDPEIFSRPMPGLAPVDKSLAATAAAGAAGSHGPSSGLRSIPQARTPIELERVIRGTLRALRADGAILGAQVAVFKSGTCVADVCTGKLGPLDHRRVTPATRFPVFGLGRALASASLFELSRRGSCALEGEVATVWPEFAAKGKGGCTISDLLRCRSGVEGWLPEDVQVSSLLNSKGMAAAIALATPRLVPTLADFDRKYSPASASAALGPLGSSSGSLVPVVAGEQAESASALDGKRSRQDDMDDASSGASGEDLAVGPEGDDDEANAGGAKPAATEDVLATSDAADAAAAGPRPMTWRALPQGPTADQEACSHLYFGWGWAAGELLRRVGGEDTAGEAIAANVAKPMQVLGEVRLGPCQAPKAGIGSTGAPSERVEGGGQDDGADSPPDEDLFAPVATVELCSEDELRTAAKRAARAGSVAGAQSEVSDRRSLLRSTGSSNGLMGAGEATAVGSDERAAEEDDAAADAHVMKTLMAAVALHSSLSRAGLGDLEGLASGGKEHLVDPRAVNAKRIRGADLPNVTAYASARAVACAGAAIMERLAIESAANRFATVTVEADGSLATRKHADAGKEATPTSVTVGAVAYEACKRLGFRYCPFSATAGFNVEARAFAMGAMGGSILICDPASRVSVAITVNRLLPQRGQSMRLVRDIFGSMGLGAPIESLDAASFV